MEQAGASFGWTTYTVVDQKEHLLLVVATAWQVTTARTTKTWQLHVSVALTVGIFR